MLMSMFDPSNSIMKMNIIMILLFPYLFFKIFIKMKLIIKLLMMEFMKNSNLLKKNMMKISISIFIIFFLMNNLNMIPYSPIITAQVQTNLSINMTFWMCMFMFSLKNFHENFLIKLTPTSTPSFLMMFMVLIELISMIIRPFTLTLRLTANMIAGHILMFLTSSMLNFNLFFLMPLMIIAFLEFMMAFLQAFILFTLMSLYFNDIK